MTSAGRVIIVAGTRPELIKLASVFEWMKRLNLDFQFIWSGQHYDHDMSTIFMEQLGIPRPDTDLDVRSGTDAQQTSKVMLGIEESVKREHASLVLAQGDTNTVVATALAATKSLVPFAHVEAGLRSWDRTMPEEINRVVADSVAEIHFAPTKLSAINLAHEGVALDRIHVTGNTVVDAIKKCREQAVSQGQDIINKLALDKHSFALITIHRRENTDDVTRLNEIIEALTDFSSHLPVVFPVHPRTKKTLSTLGILDKLTSHRNIFLLEPQGYFEFLGLLSLCRIVLTDSGGVQEEALTLMTPTVTLRYNTERPETVLAGINRLTGVQKKHILKTALNMSEKRDEIVSRLKSKANPLGDGRAGERIAKMAKRAVEEGINLKTCNTCKDPHITYRLTTLSPPKSRVNTNVHIEDNIITAYNSQGFAEVDIRKASKIVVRGPKTSLENTSRGVLTKRKLNLIKI
ncbi:MAG: UDP-N-acetylglucosamine 2-epimerase (non-hydrolyzing) [Thaumarchaeota archaeon]|nr:UDP-N-acetylglucosamine 2-epimerase (non-hydrolyzing) [Nitrososphaerota archaeon]MCL5317800.1 UDP-N-acetylglucosamine 2-epimerase (non-hydrolyzing) [Nitrososphaerota archaeon]